jgi:heterodisulfide reductase subunit A-like polyferredoxin
VRWAIVEYDDPSEGLKNRAFDLVILSDGIHAGVDNSRLAEICKLSQDKDGFLQTVGSDSGIYVCGCTRAPMKIDESYADAVTVAGKIIQVLR